MRHSRSIHSLLNLSTKKLTESIVIPETLYYHNIIIALCCTVFVVCSFATCIPKNKHAWCWYKITINTWINGRDRLEQLILVINEGGTQNFPTSSSCYMYRQVLFTPNCYIQFLWQHFSLGILHCDKEAESVAAGLHCNMEPGVVY